MTAPLLLKRSISFRDCYCVPRSWRGKVPGDEVLKEGSEPFPSLPSALGSPL